MLKSLTFQEATTTTTKSLLLLAATLIITNLSLVIGQDSLFFNNQYGQQEAQQQSQAQQPPAARQVSSPFRRERVSWCTTSLLERKKCLDWARAIEDVNIQFEGQEPFKLNLDCVQGADKDQCMGMIDDERADMILLDPGEIGVAGRYHSLTPIMVERYGVSSSLTNSNNNNNNLQAIGHYSVAIVKKRSSASIQNLADLFGKRACFSGVSHMASWTLPLASLIDLPSFEIADCNNLVKSASYFFGNSCAPNALINKFNPTGDNPQKMSQLCERQGGRVGAHSEPSSGAFSALKCLADLVITSAIGSGAPSGASGFLSPPQQPAAGIETARLGVADVAFVPHNTVFLAEKLSLSRELRLEVPSRNELELLCPQGGRMPLDRWASCNFGFVPAHAVIVSSRTSQERREAIQRFLKTSVQLFSGVSSSNGPPISSSVLYTSSSSFRSAPSGQDMGQGQQQSLSNFDFGYPQPDNSRWRPQQQVSSSASTSSSALPPYSKLNTNFKLTGDYSLINYPSLDVLFSSDMVDLMPLTGVGQTFKGFLNSFPVQSATTTTTTTTNSNNPNNPLQSNQNNHDSPFSSYFYSSSPRSGQSSDSSSYYTFEAIKSQTDYFEKLRRCSVPAAVLCVTSDKEFNKCQAMSKAFHAAGLKPELNCKLAQSTLACMQLIKNRDADLLVLDAADIYLAGVKFNLIPIVSEQIEMYESSHFAVAVAKKSEQSIDLFNLKGKLSCHSGYLRGAGWVVPMHFLLSNDRMRIYDNCNTARSAAEHFDKSCAPGILASMSNLQNDGAWTIRNMCELCHGTGRAYCAQDASEPFSGDTGAFRCLVEGGGQVAFLKHTALFQNTGGSNRETWARNLIKSDFELLCRDGSRAPVNDYKKCNLGTVPPNALVTRGDTPFRLIDAYVNLFMYGQQYYGSKYSEEYTFKMFSSTNERDLIFQDATQQLVRVPISNQTYNSYLNFEFLRAMETVFCGA